MNESLMFDGLSDELCEVATQYHDWWRQKYDGESVYAFGFYTPPCVEFANIVVFTDEGLRKVANEYRENDDYADQTIDALMNDLRWSPADSPHCGENGDDIFSAVNERLADISETTHGFDDVGAAFDRHLDLLYNCLISALLNFRAGPLAGSRKPLLSVWFGDQSPEEIEYFIEHCNDDEMVAWYRRTCEASG